MLMNIKDLGIGLMVLALVIGVASITLSNIEGVGSCTADKTWNTSGETCSNATGSAAGTGHVYTNTNYMLGQFGTSGLSGWTPAIIAFSVGMLFIGGILALTGGRKY